MGINSGFKGLNTRLTIDGIAVEIWRRFSSHASTDYHRFAYLCFWLVVESTLEINIYKLRALIRHCMLIKKNWMSFKVLKILIRRRIKQAKNSLCCKILLLGSEVGYILKSNVCVNHEIKF